MAVTRRIIDLIKTTVDHRSVGLKPKAVKMMQDSKDHYEKVLGFLEDRTRIRLKELALLINSF
jgi:hypothetical protein